MILKGVGDFEAGDNKKAEDGNSAKGGNDDSGKLFASDNAAVLMLLQRSQQRMRLRRLER